MEHKERPQRFWHGQDIKKLTFIRAQSDCEVRVGDRVRLKPTAQVEAPVTRHGRPEGDDGICNIRTLLVVETQTSVDILWQDGTEETTAAKDVVPYLNPDEYDCW